MIVYRYTPGKQHKRAVQKQPVRIEAGKGKKQVATLEPGMVVQV